MSGFRSLLALFVVVGCAACGASQAKPATASSTSHAQKTNIVMPADAVMKDRPGERGPWMDLSMNEGVRRTDVAQK